MKKIVMLVAVLSLISIPCAAQAKEKTKIHVSKDRVEIMVGLVSYVFHPKDPDTLTSVRIWANEDQLEYDITPTTVQYGDRAKLTDPMSQSQMATEWATHVKKFKKVRKEIDVFVDY